MTDHHRHKPTRVRMDIKEGRKCLLVDFDEGKLGKPECALINGRVFVPEPARA